MGEKEQSGMLRTVVVIGLIAIISLVIIVAVVALKGTMGDTNKTTLQTVSKGISNKTIDFTLKGDNGNLTSLTSNTDLVGKGFFADVASGHQVNNQTSYDFPHYAAGTTSGIQAELYLNNSKLPYILESGESDYIEVSIDYKVVNAKPLTFDEAKSLNIDTQRSDGLQGIRVGLRSDSNSWNDYKIKKLTGDMSGTIVADAPKGPKGTTFEAYVMVGNTSYDSIELGNVQISNATH